MFPSWTPAKKHEYYENHKTEKKKYDKNYYALHQKDLQKYAKDYRKEHLVERKAYEKNYRKRNKEIIRKKMISSRYGISVEDYDRMWNSQHGLCAMCGKPLHEKTVVDHDHKTNRVRGILHPSCNLGVSFVETEDFVSLAITYLNRTKL
jgi:hypothetical protein